MASDHTNVEILDEVSVRYKHGATLCFQAVRYHIPNQPFEDGFRFSWRDGRGHLLPLRGQTRIPSLRIARLLMAIAEERPAFRNHRGADADDLPTSVNI
ncbi:hypothetical protein [Mesorhizobium sp. M0977]|uniref:hypothetical protein n=1 Tax=Mesorhizobium sp. M0977 TaxID=2957039 RepID=UPI00333928EA